jgi:hypothetical protein
MPEMLTSEFPLFLRVTLSELLFPTATSPKFKLVALEINERVAAMLCPFKEILVGEFIALLMSVTDPLMSWLEAVGAKTILNTTFLPAATAVGKVSPVMLNPAPDTGACEIIALPFPLFISVIVCELLLPATTS